MKRIIVGAALAVRAARVDRRRGVGGEITGNGKATPVAGYQAASSCSFSGYNDTYSGDPSVPDAEGFFRTQSWGQLPRELRALVRAGQSPDPEHLQAPNVACNPAHGGH